MKTKHIELYKYLESIDFSNFNVDKKYKIEISENVRKYLRFLGTEFDRTFNNIISQINPIETTRYMKIYIESNFFHDPKLLLPITYSKGSNTEYNKDFNITEFVKDYNFQKSNSYGIKDEQDIKYCQEYLVNLYSKINFEKFIAKNNLITGLEFTHNINKAPINSGCIDLILDDKIIDIKTNIKITKIPRSYISQLLYYYIYIKYIIDPNNKNITYNGYAKKITINKVCLYYAHFDLLIEFDVKKLFPNEKQFMSILNNELVYGNNRIREIVDKAICNKKFDTLYFKTIESKIIEKRQKILKYQIENRIKLNELKIAEQTFKVFNNEFPKSDLAIFFRVYLNFLFERFDLDKKIISKHYASIIIFIDNYRDNYEKNLSDEYCSFDRFHAKTSLEEYGFNDLIIKAKLLSNALNNLKYFKLYVDYCKNKTNLPKKEEIVVEPEKKEVKEEKATSSKVEEAQIKAIENESKLRILIAENDLITKHIMFFEKLSKTKKVDEALDRIEEISKQIEDLNK